MTMAKLDTERTEPLHGRMLIRRDTQATDNYQHTRVTNNNNNNNNNNNMNCDQSQAGTSDSSLSSQGCDSASGKYLLRPRSVRAFRRCGDDWNLHQDSRRQKSRPAPLSKYRRKTANTRERYRMRQINTAFEKLRKMLPAWQSSHGTSEMTKITTLKHACAYIRSLQDVLEGRPSVSQHSRAQETCPWVLSNMLDNAAVLQETQMEACQRSSNASPTLAHHRDAPQSDLMALLCDSTDSGVFDDNMESLPFLSAMSDVDEVAMLLLGGDTQPASSATYWHDQQTQFAVC